MLKETSALLVETAKMVTSAVQEKSVPSESREFQAPTASTEKTARTELTAPTEEMVPTDARETLESLELKEMMERTDTMLLTEHTVLTEPREPLDLEETKDPEDLAALKVTMVMLNSSPTALLSDYLFAVRCNLQS